MLWLLAAQLLSLHGRPSSPLSVRKTNFLDNRINAQFYGKTAIHPFNLKAFSPSSLSPLTYGSPEPPRVKKYFGGPPKKILFSVRKHRGIIEKKIYIVKFLPLHLVISRNISRYFAKKSRYFAKHISLFHERYLVISRKLYMLFCEHIQAVYALLRN